MIDRTQEYPEMGSSIQEKRRELYNQLRYITNELERLDAVYGNGFYYLTEDETRAYMKISDEREIPKELPCSRLGREKIYLKQDVDEYLLAKKH